MKSNFLSYFAALSAFILFSTAAYPANVNTCNPSDTLKLTDAAIKLGFTLQPIITGLPTGQESYGIIGAYGITPTSTGNIMVTTRVTNDSVVRVYTNSENACGSKLVASSKAKGLNSVAGQWSDLASLDGKIYMILAGSLVQLNDSGIVAKVIIPNFPQLSGDITAASSINSLIFGNTNILVTAPNGGSAYNGLIPAPAAYQIYGALNGGAAYFDSASSTFYESPYGVLYGFSLNALTASTKFSLVMAGGPYGGGGFLQAKVTGPTSLNGLFVLNELNTAGDIALLNVSTGEKTIIATTTSSQAPGHSAGLQDGSLVVGRGGNIWKLRCPGCSFFSN